MGKFDKVLRGLVKPMPDKGKQEAQLEEFEREAASLEAHVAEAKRLAAGLLTRDARILMLDISQGFGPPPAMIEQLGGDELLRLTLERQFGGSDSAQHAEIFRFLLGVEKGDERFTVWDIAKEPDLKGLPYPDVWLMSGGPAMTSELDPGKETANTRWLRRAVEAVQELQQARVPGLAVCLGHQVSSRAMGAKIGRAAQREFGTVKMEGTEVGKGLSLLAGFWDDKGLVDVSASHVEQVTSIPEEAELQIVTFNEYSALQGFAKALREGQSVEEADAEDELMVTLQNHPEILGLLLRVIGNMRGEALREEGIEPLDHIYRDTPQARVMFLNFIKLASRRLEKRT